MQKVTRLIPISLSCTYIYINWYILMVYLFLCLPYTIQVYRNCAHTHTIQVRRKTIPSDEWLLLKLAVDSSMRQHCSKMCSVCWKGISGDGKNLWLYMPKNYAQCITDTHTHTHIDNNLQNYCLILYIGYGAYVYTPLSFQYSRAQCGINE